MILVTGATGRVGYRVLEALADARAEAIAMVRVEAKGLDLPGPGENLVAAFDDPPAAEQLQDFDRVFLLSPSSEAQAELEIAFIDALVAAGHRPHVVKVAAEGFLDPGCDVRFMRSHREIARHLDATGLPVSYLAPAPFMEMLLPAAPAIRREATLYAPAGHARVGFVAAADVADAAAQLLTGPVPADGGEPGVFTLTGPDSLSYSKVATRISAVFARQVRYARPAGGAGPGGTAGFGHGALGGRGDAGAVRVDPRGRGWPAHPGRAGGHPARAPRAGRLARRGSRRVPGARAGRSAPGVLEVGYPGGWPAPAAALVGAHRRGAGPQPR